MGIETDKLKAVSRVELPEKLWFLRKQGALTVWRLQKAASEIAVQASSASGRDPCSSILLESKNEKLLVLTGQAKPPKSLEHLKAVRATEVAVADGLLEMKNPRWVSSAPEPSTKRILAETKNVQLAWTQGIRFKREIPGEQDGLRLPQQGALHSIAAHCSLKDSPSTVVLPTGTGKTEVMIATCMLIGLNR